LDKLGKILDSVSVIIENSDKDILTQINNISDIMEVDKKTAITLHFVNRDFSWNPQTLYMLEDIGDKLPIGGKKLELNSEKIKQNRDFYLLNYLNKAWSKRTIEHIKRYGKMSFFNVWLRKITSKIIKDVDMLGLYPESNSEFIVDRNFPGEGLVHPTVSKWLAKLIDEANQTKNQTLS
jgi:hypothetical protein|tara:strand:- start:96 stop:632 length:537 start_codon:yes stop_codon:yes gene_type:complete